MDCMGLRCFGRKLRSHGLKIAHLGDILSETNYCIIKLRQIMDVNYKPLDHGCYTAFYEQGLWYLSLLNLNKAFEFYRPIVYTLSNATTSPTWQTDTVKLLAEINWRSHLAPIVSYLILNASNEQVDDAIWSAIRNGSWVSPQLVVCLYMKNYDFQSQLPALVSDGVEQPIGTPLELHVKTGPGNASSRLGKILNSLSGLGFTDWGQIPSFTINTLKKQDRDNADSIARGWCKRITRILQLSSA